MTCKDPLFCKPPDGHWPKAASPVADSADRSAAASPVACDEDERLRRIFGEVGVPPVTWLCIKLICIIIMNYDCSIISKL